MLDVMAIQFIIGIITYILLSLSKICFKKHYSLKDSWNDYDTGGYLFHFFGIVFLGFLVFFTSMILIKCVLIHSLFSLFVICSLSVGIIISYFLHRKFLEDLSKITKCSKFNTMFSIFYYENILLFTFSPISSILLYYLFKIYKQISFENVFSKSLKEFKNK